MIIADALGSTYLPMKGAVSQKFERVVREGIIAIGAGLIDEDLPFIAPFLRRNGWGWIRSVYPALGRRRSGIAVRRRPISDDFGIRTIEVLNDGPYQWLVARTLNRSIEYLFYQDRFVGAFDRQKTGIIDFEKSSKPKLKEMLGERKRRLNPALVGLVQRRRRDWGGFRSILNFAARQGDCKSRTEIFAPGVGGDSSPLRVNCVQTRGVPIYLIADLAFRLYRPDRLYRRPLLWDDFWFRPDRLPILALPPEEMSSRDFLEAEVAVDRWLAAGGIDPDRIREGVAVDTETRRAFAGIHRASGYAPNWFEISI